MPLFFLPQKDSLGTKAGRDKRGNSRPTEQKRIRPKKFTETCLLTSAARRYWRRDAYFVSPTRNARNTLNPSPRCHLVCGRGGVQRARCGRRTRRASAGSN